MPKKNVEMLTHFISSSSSSSSSSCRATGTDIPDPLSPLLLSLITSGRSSWLHPHIAVICMFELVILLLLGHMWGSIGVHHL